VKAGLGRRARAANGQKDRTDRVSDLRAGL
jgi:hypothetical protein